MQTILREIYPASAIDAQITLPGSKYIANRLLPMCALASSPSCLKNVVMNEDIKTAIAGLSQLGYVFNSPSSTDKFDVTTAESLRILPRSKNCQSAISLYTAHSGTFSRFVTAIAALESVPVHLGCSEKMATRPMQELFSSLESLGVTIDSETGGLPATISGPITKAACRIDASRSSQYLSALLLIAPLLPTGLEVEVSGSIVSRAYVDMTLQLMAKMGVDVSQSGNRFCVAAGQVYQGIDYSIPCDPVSASYFMGAAAISKGKVAINQFDFDSCQGEAQFYQVLQQMGVTVKRNSDQLTLIGPEVLTGVDVDMGEMPDAVQTLAVVACFATGVTRIRNIAHLAYKESNRIEDTANEIRKTGIRVESGYDYLAIEGGKPAAARIETHEDHRMAMSMALLGIKTPGIHIANADVVNKSFPDYWNYLEKIGVSSKLVSTAS